MFAVTEPVLPVAVLTFGVGVVVVELVGYSEFDVTDIAFAVVDGPSAMMPGLSGRRSTVNAVLVAVTGAVEVARRSVPAAVPPTDDISVRTPPDAGTMESGQLSAVVAVGSAVNAAPNISVPVWPEVVAPMAELVG